MRDDQVPELPIQHEAFGVDVIAGELFETADGTVISMSPAAALETARRLNKAVRGMKA